MILILKLKNLILPFQNNVFKYLKKIECFINVRRSKFVLIEPPSLEVQYISIVQMDRILSNNKEWFIISNKKF